VHFLKLSNLIFYFFPLQFLSTIENFQFYLLIKYTVHLLRYEMKQVGRIFIYYKSYSFIYHNNNGKSALSTIIIMASLTVMVLKSMGSHPAFRAYNFIPFFRKIFRHWRWSWRGPQRWLRLRSFFLPLHILRPLLRRLLLPLLRPLLCHAICRWLRVPAPILRVKHQAHVQLRHFRFRPPELFRSSPVATAAAFRSSPCQGSSPGANPSLHCSYL
jgi:hypothetical protein